MAVRPMKRESDPPMKWWLRKFQWAKMHLKNAKRVRDFLFI